MEGIHVPAYQVSSGNSSSQYLSTLVRRSCRNGHTVCVPRGFSGLPQLLQVAQSAREYLLCQGFCPGYGHFNDCSYIVLEGIHILEKHTLLPVGFTDLRGRRCRRDI